MSRIKELRQRKADLVKEADDLNVLVDEGTASEEQAARLEVLLADDGEIAKVNASIKREERLMDERRSIDAVVPANADTESEALDRVQADGERVSFASFGEQMQAIAMAGQKGIQRSEWDPRLQGLYEPGGIRADASGVNQAVPSEGGFLIQQDFAAPMLETMFETGLILPQVRRMPLSGNSNGMKIPSIDETSRANGSRWGGVQAYWANEADTVTGTRPKFKMIDLSLNKLMGIGYVTDEMLADSAFLGALMSMAFTDELTFKAEDGVINGTGAGQMLGVMNSGALISVAKESGQAAQTVVTDNILNMMARLSPRSLSRSVWLINQDILPQLWGLTLGTGTAVVLLYRPPGVDGPNVNAPAGTLGGRPVIPIEQAATLGTTGDIMLLDLDQYMMIDKAGIQQQSSMHVRFLYDEMTFRFTYRVDGQPIQRAAVTPKNGTATLSPYVALATRS